MAKTNIALTGFFLFVAVTSPAFADGWEVKEPAAAANLQLIYKGDHQTSYLFECYPTEVVLTQFGVTDLLDLQTNAKIGDTPGSAMTPGAAFMGLATSTNGTPNFKPAEAAPNAVEGWDMTLRFDKSDKALKALAKAKMVSVFTTGYTMAVGLNDTDRQSVRSFLSRCGVKI